MEHLEEFGMFNLEKQKLQEDVIAVFKYLKFL